MLFPKPHAIPVFVMLPLDTVRASRVSSEPKGSLRPPRDHQPMRCCSSQVNGDGVFKYAGSAWFANALQLLSNSGAYGVAMATRFNGYGDHDQAILTDAPMASMYGLAPRSIPTPRPESGTVVKLSRARSKKRRRK